MAGGLGSLVLEIGANVAKFTEDMGRVSAIAEASGRRMEAAFNLAKRAIQGIVIEESGRRTFEYLKEAIDKSIESSAGLVQLSERTGATVENLSALSAVAKLSGTDTEELATGLQKLAKSMVDAESGGTKTSAAFQAIGINVKSLAGLNPDQVFLKIAQQLATFADGTGKTVVATELLGKSGARLLPTLKDLGDAGQYNATTSRAQAEAAEAYEKDLKRLQLAGDALWRTISAQLVPVFDAFAKALIDTTTNANGLKGQVDSLAADGSITNWAESGAKALAFIIDAFDGIARAALIAGKAIGASAAAVEESGPQFEKAFDAFMQGKGIPGAIAAFASGTEKDFKSATDVFRQFAADVDSVLGKETFRSKLAKQIEASHRAMAEEAAKRPPVPTTGLDGASDKRDVVAKAQYEASLKALQDFISAENQQFSARESALKGLYDDDKISITSYFTQRQDLLNAHEVEIRNAYEDEIAAAQKYLNGIKNVNEEIAKAERAAVSSKIAELRTKEQIATSDAQQKSIANTRDQINATDAYSDSIIRLNITLAQMQGNLAEADRLEEELYKKQLLRQVGRGGNAPGDVDLANKAVAAKVAQDEVNEAQKSLSIIEQHYSNVEARIALEQRTGATTELQGLKALGGARQAEIAKLEKILVTYKELAIANPLNADAAANVENLTLKIDQLKAAADPLAEKFNNLLENTFVTEFDKVIHGTESVSDAFRNMAISIVDELLKIELQQIAIAAFGGSTGGVGGAVAAAFAGGTKASGGNVMPGSSYLVGEKGPEMFSPHSAGSIMSNQQMAPQITVSPQIINVHDPSEIPTAMQGRGGEQAILNVISRNPGAIRNILR